MENSQQNPDVKKLAELIKDIRVCMMTTVSEKGGLYSRPMSAQGMAGGELFFFTSEDTGKVDALRMDGHVNLAYADPAHNRFVSIAGWAQVRKDPDLIKRYWSEFARAWFPKGVEDPSLVVIQVKAESAEYWDAPSGKLVQAFGLVKAALTGKPSEAKPGENERVQIA